MIRALVVVAILALPLATAAAQTEAPQSAFGITVGTPVDTLPTVTMSPSHGIHVIETAPVPLDGSFIYGVLPGPDGGACDVIAHTPDLMTAHAGP